MPFNNPVSLVTNYMVLEKWFYIYIFGFYVIRRYITIFVELLFGTPPKPVNFIQHNYNVKSGSISWVIRSHLLSHAHFSTSNCDVTEFEGVWRKVVVRYFKELYWYLNKERPT